jgi:hypothetical protein
MEGLGVWISCHRVRNHHHLHHHDRIHQQVDTKMTETMQKEREINSVHITITVTKDMNEWLQGMPRSFKLSKIIRAALDDYKKCAEEGVSPSWLKE